MIVLSCLLQVTTIDAFLVLTPVPSDVFYIELDMPRMSLMFSLPSIIIREVHEEAKLAREKASDIKMLRQEQAAARREKLKQAYLKKKLEKLKASSKAEQT